jgi:Lar family restriction alleviation protein
MTDKPKIEPCPFCKLDKHVRLNRSRSDYGFFAVRCGECDAEGPCFKNKEDAINAWNLVSSHVQNYLEMNPRADGSDNRKLSEVESSRSLKIENEILNRENDDLRKKVNELHRESEKKENRIWTLLNEARDQLMALQQYCLGYGMTYEQIKEGSKIHES